MSRTSLHGLELLVGIDDHGSISAAARALGLSQPTVSAGVDRLERTMATRLVERSTRGSVLNAEGKTVAGWAREVLEASDRFESRAARIRGQGSTHLVVAASMTTAENLVPGWLPAWRRRRQSGQPVLEGLPARPPTVELLVRNSADVMRAVLDGEAELGFVEGDEVWNGLRGVTIGHDELVLVVGRGHPWADRRTPVGPAELVEAPLVLREQGSGTRQVLERALGRAGVALPDTLPQLGSTAAIKAAVQQGDAVGVISALAVASELAQGSFVQVHTSDLDLGRNLRLVARSRGRLSPAAQDLASVIVESRADAQS